ncbi:MAG: hypothetical protein RBS99_11555 [Rhodospirillales bacterium]|jgi:hypothetical protein|nr:hypothetical protein [Rhodospirillales bacterium]
MSIDPGRPAFHGCAKVFASGGRNPDWMVTTIPAIGYCVHPDYKRSQNLEAAGTVKDG